MITRIGPNFIRLKNFRTWEFSKLEIEATLAFILSCDANLLRITARILCIASVVRTCQVRVQWSSRNCSVSSIITTTRYNLPPQPSSQYLCFKNPVRSFYSFLTNDLFCFLGTIVHIVFLLRSFHFDLLALTARGNVVDQKRSIAVVQLHCKQQVQQLLQESHSFSCSFLGMKEGDVATYFSGKYET